MDGAHALLLVTSRGAVGPEELHWVEGASHIDLYDGDTYVTPAVARLAEFVNTRLTA